MKAHRFLSYDNIEKKYRRIDTNELLSNKESHHNYILLCIKEKED